MTKTLKYFFLFLAITVNIFAAKKENIYLEHCETLSFDKERLADCQVLNGNVIFRHDAAFLYCDSAYFYEKSNSVEAFGHIKLEQGDTLFVYGDILHYDGDTRMARLKGNVRMINRETTLETDSLDYDRNINVGYYYTGGKIYDKSAELTSIWGEYSPSTKLAIFKQNVRLLSEKSVLGSDNLKYNTQSKVAFIVGPSVLVHEEKTTIYAEEGWYNTVSDQSYLTKKSSVEHIDGKKITADSIFYDNKNGYGKATNHAIILDKEKQMSINGNYAYFRNKDDYALVHDSAYVCEFSTADTMFMHADTLRMIQNAQDTTVHHLWAIGNVRFFRSDMQGRCDSATFSTADSIANLYESPVLWSDSLQLTGEFMQIFIENKQPKELFVTGWAAGVMQEDSLRYNQLGGKKLHGFIEDNELRKMIIEGNAETIYYPKEEDGSIVGVNRSASSTLTVYLKEKKLDRIVLSPNASGTLYPEEMFPEDEKQLKNFSWQENIRPKNKFDIFTRYAKHETTKRKKRLKQKGTK